MTTIIQEIPLSQLVPSKLNVRRTAPKARVEELAASISAHGLLQNLTVRRAPLDKNKRKERFEVIAGGRRLAALKLLARRRQVAGNAPVPCQVIEEGLAEEISLAENALQCPMHPADQFEAFAKLHDAHGLSAEDIAARFGVTAAVVRQRLTLGRISPKLMKLYRKEEMNLDQLTAFTLTDDHARQEQVWEELPEWDRSRHAILARLNEAHVALTDRRARCIGIESYEQAGGTILRDLFEEDEAYFTDAGLLDQLVGEKLAAAAEEVKAEGWKWVEVAPTLDYETTSGMRRIYPEEPTLSEADEARLAELREEFEAVDDDALDEAERLDQQIAALCGEERFEPEQLARAGAFVCLSGDGSLRIERGYVRKEDMAAEPKKRNGKMEGGREPAAISDALMTELTAHRTAALRHALGDAPDLALRALAHALAANTFYHDSASCLEVRASSLPLARYGEAVAASGAMLLTDARHEGWARRLPEEADALWDVILAMPQEELLALLAHCTALTLNAVVSSKGGARTAHPQADALAQSLTLDMSTYWRPTAESYFGRVAKPRILEAVREGISGVTADALSGLKKQPLAKAAEERLASTGWLPEPLRTHAPLQAG